MLLVDDHDDGLAMYVVGLSALGFEVVTARAPLEAIELARTARPAAVVTDVRLGAECGIALAQALRREPGTAAAAIVLLTGDVRAHDRAPRECYDRLLLKPCTPGSLGDTLRQLLDGASPARD